MTKSAPQRPQSQVSNAILPIHANRTGSKGKQTLVPSKFQTVCLPVEPTLSTCTFGKTAYGKGLGDQHQNASLLDADSLFTSRRP